MINFIKYFGIKLRTLTQVSTSIKEFQQNYILYDKLYNLYKTNILEKNTTNISLIKLSDSKDSINNRGKFFKRITLDNKSALRICSHKDILNAKIFALGGIEFDDMPSQSALLKNIEILANANNLPSISYIPSLTRKERYNHIMQYSINNSYLPEYIFDFTRKYILPNIIHRNNNGNKAQLLTLFSFSAGGREIMMIEKALYHILKNEYEGLTEEEVDNIFSHINAISIGYACKLTSDKSPKFQKIIVYSIEDNGVLLPESLVTNYIEPNIDKLYEEKYIILPNLSNSNSKEYMIILGKDQIPKYLKGKQPNENGHALPNYIQALQNSLEPSLLENLARQIHEPEQNLELTWQDYNLGRNLTKLNTCTINR